MVSHTPFAENTDDLTITQLHDKVSELSSKYFKTQNPQLREQISTFIEYYKQEILIKQEKQRLEEQENGDLDLDNLINIS